MQGCSWISQKSDAILLKEVSVVRVVAAKLSTQAFVHTNGFCKTIQLLIKKATWVQHMGVERSVLRVKLSKVSRTSSILLYFVFGGKEQPLHARSRHAGLVKCVSWLSFPLSLAKLL